jgi:hypothetical protein
MSAQTHTSYGRQKVDRVVHAKFADTGRLFRRKFEVNHRKEEKKYSAKEKKANQ